MLLLLQLLLLQLLQQSAVARHNSNLIMTGDMGSSPVICLSDPKYDR
jgi:hypothetical protein